MVFLILAAAGVSETDKDLIGGKIDNDGINC